MKKRRRSFAVIGFLLAVPVALAVGFAALQAGRPVRVAGEKVARGAVEALATSVSAGTVRSIRASDLACEVPGIVAEVYASEGKAVRAGAPILRVSLRDLEASLQVALADWESVRRQVESAKARQRSTTRSRDRAASLVKSGAIPTERLDEAQDALDLADCEAALSESLAAKAAAGVRALEVQIDRGILRAPFEGVVTSMTVEPGESISPSRPVARLEDLSVLEVRAPIDEVDVPSVRIGAPVRISIDAFPGKSWSGKVSVLDPVVDMTKETSRTAEVRVRLENAGSGLRVGMSAQIEILVERRAGVLCIQSSLVREGAGSERPYVFVARNGRAEKRSFERGLSNWRVTEAFSGLSEGEVVVSPAGGQGDIVLQDGARIRLEGTPEGAP
ncbi:MAG: efflux RND transporter periplasmic adaptor subunit [Planctomycetota bacterium]